MLDNDVDRASATAFHDRTPAVERYLAEREVLIARAYAQGIALGIARADAASACEPTPAQQAFADQRGYAAWTPPEWD